MTATLLEKPVASGDESPCEDADALRRDPRTKPVVCAPGTDPAEVEAYIKENFPFRTTPPATQPGEFEIWVIRPGICWGEEHGWEPPRMQWRFPVRFWPWTGIHLHELVTMLGEDGQPIGLPEGSNPLTFVVREEYHEGDQAVLETMLESHGLSHSVTFKNSQTGERVDRITIWRGGPGEAVIRFLELVPDGCLDWDRHPEIAAMVASKGRKPGQTVARYLKEWQGGADD